MNGINLIGLMALLLGITLGAVGSWLLRRSSPLGKGGDASDSQLSNLQRQLRQTQLANCRLADMEQFKGGVLARTSHELRSPISQMISLHQMVLSDLCDDPAEEREFIAQANQSAFKLLERLDHLIDISKLEVGRIQPRIQSLNLANIFDKVYQLTHMQAANQALFLEVLRPDPKLYILADPKWLQQALVNLVQTAITLTETGSIRLLVPPPSPASEKVFIWLEDHRPAAAWYEPLDLIKEKVKDQNALPQQLSSNSSADSPLSPPINSTKLTIENTLSVGLKLEEVQSIFHAMQGEVEILSTPISPASDSPQPDTPVPNLTRIQCSIPIASVPSSEARG